MVRFDFGHLLQGQTSTVKHRKVLISSLLLVLDVCNAKPTFKKSWKRKLWPVNLLIKFDALFSRSNADSQT